MVKYTNIYTKNQKMSKISINHRLSFLRSIYIDRMSIKDVIQFLTKASIRWKIHYSSGKIIARTAKVNKTERLIDFLRSSFKLGKIQSQIQYIERAKGCTSDSLQSFSYNTQESRTTVNPIVIVSTIGQTIIPKDINLQ